MGGVSFLPAPTGSVFGNTEGYAAFFFKASFHTFRLYLDRSASDPLLPYVPLTTLLGGLAHARVDLRALEGWVARTSRGHVARTVEEDAFVLAAMAA